MRDLAIFRGDIRDMSWKQKRDAGLLTTSGSGISYFYGDGIRESWGKNSGIREFSFVLTKNSLALTEKKWFLSVYTAFVVKLWVSKEVKPVKFCPLSLFCVVHLFLFYYFRRFRHSERGIKSLRLEVTFVKILHFCFVDGFDLFCFCLDGPVGPGRSFGLSVCY